MIDRSPIIGDTVFIREPARIVIDGEGAVFCGAKEVPFTIQNQEQLDAYRASQGKP